MLANLSEKLQRAIGLLRNRGRLSESDVKKGLREVKLALLEADVNYLVVKDFIAVLEQRCVGSDVLNSLTPGQQVVKIVRDELTELLGGKCQPLNMADRGLSVYMLAGLQGSGKTTTTVKLAVHLAAQGKKPLVTSLDYRRPGAREQLEQFARGADVHCYNPENTDVVVAAQQAIKQAESGYDCLLLDTAGRMHVDDELMDELDRLRHTVSPTEIILVLDSMTGQDAVNVAQLFSQRRLVDSLILTKLDSDTRGGAALSVRSITGCPVKFIGTGEKHEKLERFHPDRMASQILGFGDVLTLVEKAEASFDQEQARELEKKLRRQEFTLDDFRQQLRQFNKLGSVEQISSMLPGGAKLDGLNFDQRELTGYDAIISSMTPQERTMPQIVNGSRRKRIAAGSGTSLQKVNRLLKQFAAMQKMLRQLDGKVTKKGKTQFPFNI